jgi:hypothetical protein
MASWPIFYAHNRDGLDQTAKQIEKLFSERGVPTVGKPDDFFYSVDLFSIRHITRLQAPKSTPGSLLGSCSRYL